MMMITLDSYYSTGGVFKVEVSQFQGFMYKTYQHVSVFSPNISDSRLLSLIGLDHADNAFFLSGWKQDGFELVRSRRGALPFLSLTLYKSISLAPPDPPLEAIAAVLYGARQITGVE